MQKEKEKSRQRNPNVKQEVINRPDVLGTEFTVEDEKLEEKVKAARSEATKLGIARRSRGLLTVAEQVAGDKFHERNFCWPGSKQAFPFNNQMWTVDKYFPFANGGPLFVDEPTHKHDLKPFALKQEAMQKLGHRYLLLTEGMKFHEALEALA